MKAGGLATVTWKPNQDRGSLLRSSKNVKSNQRVSTPFRLAKWREQEASGSEGLDLNLLPTQGILGAKASPLPVLSICLVICQVKAIKICPTAIGKVQVNECLKIPVNFKEPYICQLRAESRVRKGLRGCREVEVRILGQQAAVPPTLSTLPAHIL